MDRTTYAPGARRSGVGNETGGLRRSQTPRRQYGVGRPVPGPAPRPEPAAARSPRIVAGRAGAPGTACARGGGRSAVDRTRLEERRAGRLALSGRNGRRACARPDTRVAGSEAGGAGSERVRRCVSCAPRRTARRIRTERPVQEESDGDAGLPASCAGISGWKALMQPELAITPKSLAAGAAGRRSGRPPERPCALGTSEE